MKKVLLSAAASMALTAGLTGVAHADALTFWTLTKVKATVITEVTTVNKTETVSITDLKPLNSEASGLAVINSSVIGARVGAATVRDPLIDAGISQAGTGGTGSTSAFGGLPTFYGDPLNFNIHRSSLIFDSVEHNTGIGQVNQDVGNNSNQGNVIAAGFAFGGDSLAKAEAYVEELSENNSARNIEDGNPSSPNNNLITNTAFNTGNPSLTPDQGPLVPQITATLQDAFNSNTGVFMGNQNAGNNNQQHNALAAAVGSNAFTALADAGLHQVNSGNTVYDVNTVKEDLILHAVNNNTGIVAFNQSVGDNNNQATVVNVAAIASFVGLP